MAPCLMEANAPRDVSFAPQRTSSSAGGSLTMVMSTSAAAAASLGAAARRAPAATSEAAREAVRFQTTSGNPALIRLWPMGRPIRPSPIRLTLGCATMALRKNDRVMKRNDDEQVV